MFKKNQAFINSIKLDKAKKDKRNILCDKVDSSEPKNSQLKKETNIFYKVYNKFTSIINKKPKDKSKNEKNSDVLSAVKNDQEDIWKLPAIKTMYTSGHNHLQAELEELLFIKKPEAVYQPKKQNISIIPSELSLEDTDKVKKRLLSDAAKRQTIKANRVREQMDTAVFEAMTLFHENYLKQTNPQHSYNKETPLHLISASNQIDNNIKFNDDHQIFVW